MVIIIECYEDCERSDASMEIVVLIPSVLVLNPLKPPTSFAGTSTVEKSRFHYPLSLPEAKYTWVSPYSSCYNLLLTYQL